MPAPRWFVVGVGVLAMVAGCPPHDGDARDLAVWSTAEATRVVDGHLRVLEKGELDRVLKHFCDQSPAAIEKSRALLLPHAQPSPEEKPALGFVAEASLLRVARLRVRQVEPAWVGKEPWFAVEIGDHDGDGAGFVHTLGVRVRDGCLDRAVGATPPPPA
jgi:hypothetical protein